MSSFFKHRNMQPVNFEDEVVRVTYGHIILCIRNTRSVTGTQTKTYPGKSSSVLEEWTEIGPEYPGYYVSSLGRIRGLKGKIFNGKPMQQGYVQCTIINNHSQRVTRKVHVLIAKTFIPNPQGKPVVNHINGIRHDNRVPNLEWTTHSENSGHLRVSQVRGSPTRMVIQYTTDGNPIKIWMSLTNAANAIDGNVYSISRACQGRLTFYRGYKWRYYDEIFKPSDEEWRPVVYNSVVIEASNIGRIKTQEGRVIGSDTPNNKYIRVNIQGDAVLAHRLICMAWKPISNPDLYVVNHIDNNGKNNRIENLEWVTVADNHRHYRQNHLVPGSSNKCRPVQQLDRENQTVIANFGSAKEACEKTGILANNISAVCQNTKKSAGGFTWKYVDPSV